MLLLGRRNDVLAWNPLGRALAAAHLAFTDPDDPATRPNQIRLLFLDRHTRELHRDWAELIHDDVVAAALKVEGRSHTRITRLTT